MSKTTGPQVASDFVYFTMYQIDDLITEFRMFVVFYNTPLQTGPDQFDGVKYAMISC